MNDCSICCETFNKSNRSKINCKTCENDEIIVCRSCAKRYILDQPTDPSCMVCKIEWEQEFLSDNFTKTFVTKELKQHRENYLFEKQMALLPETQEYAEQLKLVKTLNKKKEELYQKRRELETKLRKMNNEIREIDRTIFDIQHGNQSYQQTEKPKFTYKCPVENCNGFLNEKFECGICDNKICKHCMEIKEEEHVCNEEKKETVALLKQDTKPCPKCGELIHKLKNGCDQMYCIKCHTAFSWNNGTIDRGTIHNPEYYRWMRENGQQIPRNPLDIVRDLCGNDVIDYTRLLRIMRMYFPQKHDSKQTDRLANNYRDHIQTVTISNMHRMLQHINFAIRDFTHDNEDNERTLRTMRANFILGNLKKEEFKTKVQSLEKKRNKNTKINDIWNLLRLVLLEYIGKISEQRYTKEEGVNEINKIITESNNIRKYCNKSFQKVGKMFNMVYPGITKEWIHVNNWETYLKEEQKKKKNNNSEASSSTDI